MSSIGCLLFRPLTLLVVGGRSNESVAVLSPSLSISLGLLTTTTEGFSSNLHQSLITPRSEE